MKNFISILFLLLAIGLSKATAQIVNIPDANFKNALVNTLCVDVDGNATGDVDADTNNDGEIQVSEAEALTVGLRVFNQNITSLIGIRSFINLRNLSCDYNQITSLDLQGLSNLEELGCSNNPIPMLNFQDLTNLITLNCGYTSLTTLDLQGLTSGIRMNYLIAKY